MRRALQHRLEADLRAASVPAASAGGAHAGIRASDGWDGAAGGSGNESPAGGSWPFLPESARVPDAVCAAAYEAADPRCRAAVKTGLALGMALFDAGSPGGVRRLDRRDARLGFRWTEIRRPAPWALIFLSPRWDAAARLAAVALCAQLAEVPRIGAVCIGGNPAPSILAALELCGVEDVFRADDAASALPDALLRSAGGRAALLHDGDLDDAAARIRRVGIPLFEERRPPRLALDRPDLFPPDVLRFCHGAAAEDALAGRRPPDGADAVLTDADGASTPGDAEDFDAGRLQIAPGCEGFWRHHGLDPDFFSVTRRGAILLEGDGGRE